MNTDFDVDHLDDVTLALERVDTRRPATPGRVRYALRRAQAELDEIGVRIVVRPKRHGRPAGQRKTNVVELSADHPSEPVADVDGDVVAKATTSVNDETVTTVTETPTEPATSLATVRQAVRLKLIEADDVPRFLGGLTLEEAIAAEQAAQTHRYLDADGNYDPPFIHRHHHEEHAS